MARFKDCSRCPRVFEKPHKYVTLCPKCRADARGQNNPNLKRKLVSNGAK